MSQPNSRRTVRFHLRVPLTDGHADQEFAALDAVLRDARIDEVLFFVPHAEERSPGLGTPDEIRASARRLAPFFESLRAKGIAPSINIWWTCSFSSFPSLPRVQDDLFRFRWAVSPEGRRSRVAACPRCADWLSAVCAMYAAYAALKPARLWIDDDVHSTLRADMHAPCFCDSCLEAMALRTGVRRDREALLAAVMADPPNPARDAWLAFQERIMIDMAAALAGAVHAASPDTHVCLMHSGCDYHVAEGRRWSRLVEALGQPRPTFRPSIGPYVETTALGLAAGLNGTRLAQAVLADRVTIAPEVENYPHTRFSKTAAVVKADLEMAQLFGIPEMTFSIFRFGGRLDLEVARSDYWQKMLGAIKPRLQKLADLGVEAGQQQGVGLFFHEEVARYAIGAESLRRPILLLRKRPWDGVLPLLGFPVRFGPSSVTALGDEAVAALSEAERERLFSGGVLMEARAAATLLRIGAGDLAGLAGRKTDTGHSHEVILDPAFGGLAGDVINTRWEGAAARFDWMAGARVVSELRGYRGERMGEGVVLFENRLGGRVAVLPYDAQATGTGSMGIASEPFQSPSFLCAPRQAQLRDLLIWLGRTPLPVVAHVDSPVYPMIARQPDRLVTALAALSADGLEKLDLEWEAPPFPVRRIRILERSNRWTNVPLSRLERTPSGTLRLRLDRPMACLETTVLTMDA